MSWYNDIFRGDANQKAYYFCFLSHVGTFVYDWGLRPNALLLGTAAVGKSHIFETIENLTYPGSFLALSHVTDKAFSTSTHFSDQTVCLHEAPLTYLGTDRYGKFTVSDPVLKDRLTRQRSSTRYFTKDDAGTRITRDDQTMTMGNYLIATNEVIPPEESPLMSRFLPFVINEVHRVGFNRADQACGLDDLDDIRCDARNVQGAQLFIFYSFLVEKAIMADIIPPVSRDAAELLVKEILNEFTRITGISTNQVRKRKMMIDLMATAGVLNAVHIALFSPLAVRHMMQKTDNEHHWRSFDPHLIISEVMPRLFVTTEIVVDIMTLMSSIWEPDHRMTILDAVATRLNAHPCASPAELPSTGVTFLRRENPQYDAQRRRVSGRRHDDRTAPDDERPYKEDYRYVAVYGSSRTEIYTRIMQSIPQNKPSENEVIRILRDSTKQYFLAHDANLTAVEQKVSVAPRPTQARSTYKSVVSDGHKMNMAPPSSSKPVDSKDIDSMSLDPDFEAAPVEKGRAASVDTTETEKEKKAVNTRWKWELDMNSSPSMEPIVIWESDPLHSGKWGVSVLIEYLMEGIHRDAMVEAITKVLSTNTIPEEGRTFITSLPYIHDYGGGEEPELMPQFSRTLHVPRNKDRYLKCSFTTKGTHDSRLFMQNSFLFSPSASADAAAAILGREAGIAFQENVDTDEYFAGRHWIRCGLDLESHAWSRYTPEYESYLIRQITKEMAETNPGRIQLVKEYPKESVDCYLRERATKKALDQMHDKKISSYFVEVGDALEKIMKKKQGKQPSSSPGSRRKEGSWLHTHSQRDDYHKKLSDRYKQRNMGAILSHLKTINTKQAEDGKTEEFLRSERIDILHKKLEDEPQQELREFQRAFDERASSAGKQAGGRGSKRAREFEDAPSSHASGLPISKRFRASASLAPSSPQFGNEVDA